MSSDDDRGKALFNQLNCVVNNLVSLTSLRLGHDLGLFREMKKVGPMSSADLAARMNLSERYTLEWCIQMAANKYIDYRVEDDTFSLPDEHADLLCPAEDGGLLPMLCHLSENHTPHYPLLKLAIQSDGGIFWKDMPGMAAAARSFFKPVYEGLLPHWIRESKTVQEAMNTDGARIADLGCGCGVSTVQMAKMFPGSSVLGIDYHEESISKARDAVRVAGVANADVVKGDARAWVGADEEGSFDVVCFFDCFHDMYDPEAVAAEAFRALKPGGVVFMIEPLSSYEDTTAAKLAVTTAPTFQGYNLCFCTPCGKACQAGPSEGKEGLGTTAGSVRHRAILEGVGFVDFEMPCADMEGEINPNTNGFRLIVVRK